ncbi:MAG: hypothetical protein ACI4V2_05565 [Alloprevotella sp.]
MTHDITHCPRADCPRSHTCLRHIAYLDLMRLPPEYRPPHVSFTEGTAERHCHLYIRHN